MPATAAGVNLDPTDPYASLDAAATEDAKRLQQYNGDWGKTLASYNAGAGAVAQYGGIPPYKETQSYVSTIMGNAQKAADAAGTTISGAVQAGQQAVGNAVSIGQQVAGQAVDAAKQTVGGAAQSVLPAVSQFGDKQLSSSEAYAACGPAAAVRFAQMYGRNPTLREAVDLAKGVGWSADTGMAGLQSESKLFDEMGIPHRVVGADWQGLAKEASSGNPVTISTPGHYFTADAYNAQTGAFHVGSSGTDLRRGSEWMTPQQMEAVMGPLQGGLAADNPNNPGASPLSQKASATTTAATTTTTPGPVAAVQQGWQAVGSGLQSIDTAVQDAAQGVQQLNQQTPGTAAVQAVQAAAPSVGAAAQDIAQRAGEAVQQAPLPFGAGKVGDVTGAVQDVARQVQVPDESNPLATRAAGGTLSTVGTVAKEATDALDKVNIASTAAREATGGDQYGKMYAQAGGPALEDEYRQLLNKRLAGDDSVNPRMTQIVDQLQAINTTIRDGKPLSEVNQALSVQNPATAPLVTAANLGAAALAAPLAAGDAPLAARALAELLQPGTNPLEIAKALTIVNDAKGSVPEVANAVDKAWQQFGGRITDTATQRAQQITQMDDSGRNQLVQAISNAVPSTRMFHGTGADFPKVDPTKVGGEDNLFGPGYYLTSSPDVAGGVVARGGEQVGPSWLVSAVKRGGGEVTSPGYAQERAVQEGLAPEQIADLQRRVETAKATLASNPGPDLRAYVEKDLAEAQAKLDSNMRGTGANVRALDVPQDLNLFNTDRGLAQPEITNLADAAARAGHADAEDFLRQVAARSGGISGEDLYNDLQRGGYGLSKTEINNLLADAGYDGITYAGGNRIPMNDANGMPIQHQATVVFPGALDKVRNAVSGTQGGQIATPFAARLGGAAAGGAAGYQTTPEDASPQERALRTGAGVVAGYAGVAAASKVVSALSDLMKPGLAAPQLEQAVKTVNETTASVPEILDQVRKMPGTAELAPVRQQVPQSSTDLLQAMLDAARAKGVDPEKLAALEQQITEMDPTAATRRALTPPPAAGAGAQGVPGAGGAVGDFLRGESGAVPLTPGTLRAGTTLGGAVAGGLAGNATTPEGAGPLERGVRITGGAALGAGLGSGVAFRGTVDQHILESLRASGLHAGPARAAPAWRGIVPETVEATKQLLLTSPTTHIGNVIGNTIELGRQPIALALGGRGDDALAGATSVVKAIPQAATNALEALKGNQLASLSEGAASIPARAPIYRALSAADAFTRTLAEYQGMSAKANQLLRDASMSPSDPGAATFLASHAADLFRAGARDGAASVFAQAGATVGGATGAGSRIQNIFQTYSRWKDGMIASSNPLNQAVGAFADFNLPFSGVPSRLLNIAVTRTPPGAQIGGAWRMGKALKEGDTAAFQKAAGETVLESSIQYLIGQNIANGNIRGPNDPDHPNGINLPGVGWVDTRELGGYALPMQIMAAYAEGWQKGGLNIPEGAPGTSELEKFNDYYGPRFNAAFNASMVPFARAIPGINMVQLLSTALQGDLTGAAAKEAQNIVNRMVVPGAARFFENATDPVARDVAKKGIASLWEPSMAAIPGLAERLPVKIDPTTGAPVAKRASGAGILVGAQQETASPLTIEADRLNKAGFKDVSAPSTYADSVTIGGSKVNLRPDEQRAVTQLTGTTLDKLSQRLDTPEYKNAPDSRKALLLQAWVNAADNSRTAAVAKVLGQPELRSRIVGGKNIAGQLVNQAQAPTPDEFFSGFDPTSGENILEQRRRRLAGAA